MSGTIASAFSRATLASSQVIWATSFPSAFLIWSTKSAPNSAFTSDIFAVQTQSLVRWTHHLDIRRSYSHGDMSKVVIRSGDLTACFERVSPPVRYGRKALGLNNLLRSHLLTSFTHS